ncbi:Chitin binding Peritrophin-A domain [Seminavis robusta]|uniref:Chitin binding Peritrophin-A domain n=1 Tax=Seminavis robusta TaxID=568900 RepID=A0A9N8DUA2_9STRA|nr:Chitin binding Peritrophin-A domain [Seminavis robusta]|eukprot:Sro376_g129760.1 Chitin binding Peritrophin-A domain (698) ;mRNA; f:41797-43992
MQQPVGGPCAVHEDCEEGYCGESSTCLGWKDRDADCTADYECRTGRCTRNPLKCTFTIFDGAICGEDNDCFGGRCKTDQGLNQCYDRKWAGEVCSDNSDCLSLRCEGTESERRCTEPKWLGEPCDEPSDCYSLFCNVDQGNCVQSAADAGLNHDIEEEYPGIAGSSTTDIVYNGGGLADVSSDGSTVIVTIPSAPPSTEASQSPTSVTSEGPTASTTTQMPTPAPSTQVPSQSPTRVITEDPTASPTTPMPTSAPSTGGPSQSPTSVTSEAPTASTTTQMPTPAPSSQVPSQSSSAMTPNELVATDSPTQLTTSIVPTQPPQIPMASINKETATQSPTLEESSRANEGPDLVETSVAGLGMTLFGVSSLNLEDVRNWEQLAALHANSFFNLTSHVEVVDYFSEFRVTNPEDVVPIRRRQLQDTVSLEYIQSLSYRSDNPNLDMNYLLVEPFNNPEAKEEFVSLLKKSGGGLGSVGYVSDVFLPDDSSIPPSMQPTVSPTQPANGGENTVIVIVVVVTVVAVLAMVFGLIVFYTKARSQKPEKGGDRDQLPLAEDTRAEVANNTTAQPSSDSRETAADPPSASALDGKQRIADRSLRQRPERPVLATATLEDAEEPNSSSVLDDKRRISDRSKGLRSGNGQTANANIPVVDAIPVDGSPPSTTDSRRGYLAAKDSLFRDTEEEEEVDVNVPSERAFDA